MEKKIGKKYLIVLLFFIVGCSNSKDFEIGKKQLMQQGYTGVKNTGSKFFCCQRDDRFSTGFECKDKNGNVVKGCFCSSPFEAVIIRFE